MGFCLMGVQMKLAILIYQHLLFLDLLRMEMTQLNQIYITSF